MKTLITVVLITIVSCTLVQAGEYASGITAKGIKVGFGLNTMSTSVNEFENEESMAGGYIGAFLTYGLSPRVSIEMELAFVSRGAGASLFGSREWRYNYIEVPVLFRYSLTEQSRLTPYLYFGPAVSFLTAANFKSSLFSHTIYTEDAANSPGFSLVFGGEVDYGRFMLDVRYVLGLTNNYDPTEWNRVVDATSTTDIFHMSSDDYMKNRSVTFLLGFKI